MASESEKGGITADIPEEAVQEALRSVEKHQAQSDVAVDGLGAAQSAANAENESLRAQLDLSMEKGREILERLKEEHERHLRAAADLENYKKRAHREREEVLKFGIEKLLKDLIPVVDNLDRALQAAPEGDPLTGGVKLVLRSFEEVLGRHGVKAFSAMGQPFDPRLHEALLEINSDQPPGTVILEQGRGYLLHERLVRPAMVGIAVTPPQEEEESETPPPPPPAENQSGQAGGGTSG